MNAHPLQRITQLRPVPQALGRVVHLHSFRKKAASRSCCAATACMQRRSTERTAHFAQVKSSMTDLRAAPRREASAKRACLAVRQAVGTQPRVQFVRDSHAAIFRLPNQVIQPVIPNFVAIAPSPNFIEAPMEQQQLNFLCRLDAPRVVPPSEIATCKTYRDAVKLCWNLRRVRNLTKRMLAERAGLYAPHVTCYLIDNKRQRDLPGWAIQGFELACDNTAISQFVNANAKLTCLEEMQLLRGVA